MSLVSLAAARARPGGRTSTKTRRPTILLVDLSDGDDRDLSAYLDQQGLSVHDAPLARTVTTDRPETEGFDAVVLITCLPDSTALAAIRRMTDLNAPPLLVVARSGESLERVLALEMGADDLVGEEATEREVLTRLHGLMRRRRVEQEEKGDPAPLSVGVWRLNSAFRALVSPEGRRLNLSSGDEAILAAFTESFEGLILDRDHPKGDVRTAISRLRRKVRRNTGLELPIQTIWGRGYRFDAPLVRT